MATIKSSLTTSASRDSLSTITIHPSQQERIAKIKRIAAEALISIAALSFLGLGAAFFMLPLSSSFLITSSATILSTYALGFTLLPKEVIDFSQGDLDAATQSKHLSLHDIGDGSAETEEIMHLEALREMWGGKLRSFLIMKDHARTLARQLGPEALSLSLNKSLDHASALDRLLGQHWSYRLLQQVEAPTFIEPAKPSYADDPLKPTRQELNLVSKGIANPCCNCFMNSALQSLMHSELIKAYILDRLSLIATHEGLGDLNPSMPDAYHIQYKGDKEHKEHLETLKDELLLSLKQETAYKAKTARLASYLPSDLVKLELTTRSVLENVFMTMTLKEAAVVALTLLTKWQSGELLSSQESRLLRVSFTKLMNRPTQLHLNASKVGDSLSHKAAFVVPGIIGDFVIFEQSQEDVNIFSRLVIESLEQLTQSVARDDRPNPVLTQIDCVFKAYTPPTEESGKEHFDPSLMIPGAEKTVAQPLFSWTPESLNGQFILDSLSSLSSYTNRKKENWTLKADEVLPNTEVGQVIDETAEYTISRPHVMIMNLNVFDSSAGISSKIPKVACKFTDEAALSISLPSSHSAEELITYSLSSFSVHSGRSLNSGHYYSFSKKTRPDGSCFWVRQDDNVVSGANVHEIKDILKGGQDYEAPFMLVLERV